jgi:hypothetical protein
MLHLYYFGGKYLVGSRGGLDMVTKKKIPTLVVVMLNKVWGNERSLGGPSENHDTRSRP